MTNPNKLWYYGGGAMAILLAILSLGYDMYAQFPSMCIILGIILSILIDSMDEIPAITAYRWDQLWSDIRSGDVPLWKWLLYLQSKLVFPTLFTIYLLLLIMQKVKLFGTIWQWYAGAAIDVLRLLWLTLVSAVLANFPGIADEKYQVLQHSKINNLFSLTLICLLSYGGMWAIFAEIASIGRIAYFVSLGVGILIALVSVMILTEDEQQ